MPETDTITTSRIFAVYRVPVLAAGERPQIGIVPSSSRLIAVPVEHRREDPLEGIVRLGVPESLIVQTAQPTVGDEPVQYDRLIWHRGTASIEVEHGVQGHYRLRSHWDPKTVITLPRLAVLA